MLLFVLNVVLNARSGERAADNPWGAPTLEWATHSPPPPFNFVALPVVDEAGKLVGAITADEVISLLRQK